MQEARDFSGFQIERLLKRRNLQQRLDEIEKEISQKNHEEAYGLTDQVVGESGRIVSNDSTRYVLFKKQLDSTASSSKDPVEKATEQASAAISVEEGNSQLDQDAVALAEADGFSQEEILAMLTTGGTSEQTSSSLNKEGSVDFERNAPASSSSALQSTLAAPRSAPPTTYLSSSESSDSDFEEVPLEASSELVLTINPEKESFEEEDDMFADVFAPSAKPPDTIALMDSSLEEQSDVESMSEQESSERETTIPTVVPIFMPIGGKARPSTIDEKVNVAEPLVEKSQGSLLQQLPPPDRSQKSPVQIFSPDEQDDAVEVIEESTHRAPQPLAAVKDSRSQTPKVAEAILVMDDKRREELENLHQSIEKEQSALIQLHGRQERLATSITDQMYLEAQVFQYI